MTFVTLECMKAFDLWPVPITVFMVKVFEITREVWNLLQNTLR